MRSASTPTARPGFEVADGGRRDRCRHGRAVPLGVWTLLEGELDPDAARISIAFRASFRARRGGRPRSGRRHRPGPGGARGAAARRGAVCRRRRRRPPGREDRRARGAARRSGAEPLAAWSLGEGRGPEVADRGPLGLRPLRERPDPSGHGPRLVRGGPIGGSPRRVTRHALSRRRRRRPRLGARARGRGPGDLRDGVYAVRLRSFGGCEDVVPFVVRRPPGADPARSLGAAPHLHLRRVLVRARGFGNAGSGRPEDCWVARNRLASLYDRHEDGVGVYEATLRRPLTQLRPAYRCAQHGGPHRLART